MKKCSFSTAALFPRDSAEALRLIAKAGFHYAELMPQCFGDLSYDFVQRALDTGVQVASVHYPLAMFSMLYNAHPGMAAEAKEFNRVLAGAAGKLGAGVIVIHPHNYADPKYIQLLENPIVENIRHLADLCMEYGITLAVENNPKSPGAGPRGLLEYISRFSHEAMAPMADTTEVFEAGLDPAEFIKEIKPVHVHLSDYKGNTKHIPAGKGDMDWEGIREALKDYKGFLTLEPSYRYYMDDAEPMLKEALEFLTGLFG